LDFTLDRANAATVARICRKLDGLPLAIELAAAQIGILSPQAVLTRLESDLPFIIEGARDSPPRHRSLGAAVSWSYDLLEPQMQLVFRRCGVFNGSFDVRAAAAVIEAPGVGDHLTVLAQLVEKNLIRAVQPAADEPRFRLLESIRSFGVELLGTCGELAEMRRRHARYFVELAEDAEPALVGPAMGDTLDRLEREYDNFRAVLTWSVESGELELGLRLAGALNRFWMMRGRLSEARHWLERALPLGAGLGASIRAKAFNTAGVLAGLQGDATAAEPHFLESYRLWEQVGDTIRMAAATGNLGLVAQDRQDNARALECFARAEALYAEAGDRRGVAVSIGSRAHLARQQGHTLESVRLFEQTLAVFREVGDPRGMGNCLANFAHALIALGRPRDAIPHLVECLELRRSLGNTLAIAECLEGFAGVAMAQRQARRAARLLGAAAVLREMTGAPPTLAERRQQELMLQRIREALTPGGLAREEALGRAMSLEEAMKYALDRSQPAARTLPLSERELHVARLVARGLTNRQVAEVLSLTRRTVATHLEHIFAKLGLQTRAELAAWMVRHELAELQPTD
jgi:non-specific serine/threonine protein kinase